MPPAPPEVIAPSEKDRGSSLFSRILLLLATTIVVMQSLTAAIVFSLPPPLPNLYRLSEIAQALRQGAPPGSRLTLTRVAKVARPWERSGADMELARQQLAAILGVSPDDIVLYVRGIRLPPERQIVAQLDRSLGAAGREGDGFLVGDFVVGVRQADGRWSVMRPLEPRSPTEWPRYILLWLLLTGGFAVALAAGFAQQLSRPIKGFAVAAERLGRNPSAQKIDIAGPAEIRMAARALNDMQDRLDRYIRDRTQMVGAIAHDLRTPLTRMRFATEALPGGQRSRFEGNILEMEAMIDSTLAFVRDAASRAEQGPLDLWGLVDLVVTEQADAGRCAEINAPSGVIVVLGDLISLRRLFGNLVDNAVKFGERARVCVTERGQDCVVDIDDDGPGVPLSELARVFEPFYRGEWSRSRETGGIGLGLAVARSIARAHGGDVELINRESGLRARVTLPLAQVGTVTREHHTELTPDRR